MCDNQKMESRISKPCELIAAFDLDHTLLKPIGKNKFPKDRNDATLVYPQVWAKLNELQKNGYKIVIFTNQRGIGKHITAADIYYKIDKNLPRGEEIDVYISYGHDCYRKPSPGLFDKFIENNNTLCDIFYVGDAAGRPGDFSASDSQFAYNCGIQFYTPEQFFLGKKEDVPKIPKLKRPRPVVLRREIPERTVVLLVGRPGVGKSTLSVELAEKYSGTVIINNDTTGSAVRSLKIFKQELKAETSRIIIDNTNGTVLTRASFIEPAKDFGYKVYAVKINLAEKYAQHLNWYRAYTCDAPIIPEIAYRVFDKRFEPITKGEGYDRILDFVPDLPAEIFDYSF